MAKLKDPVYKEINYIGQELNGFIILGARTGQTTYEEWKVRCSQCGFMMWTNKYSITRKRKGCRHCYSKNMRGANSPHWRGGKFLPLSYITHIKQACKRGREIEFNLSIEYLEDLWGKQGGKCALSGIELTIHEVQHTVSSQYKRGNASLDRIDSSLGYVKGNVQWVDKRINLMKQDFTQEDFIELCEEVTLWKK